MKRLIGCALLALSLSLAACGEDPVPEQGKDASVVTDDAGTCAVTCSGACCDDGQTCYQDACCTPACDGKECGDNGCGGSCGSCAGTEECSAAGQCEPKCVPETNEAFCARLQKECGSVTAPDNCGQSRTWNCGQCDEGFQCNLQTNTCSCTSESDNDFCARLDKQCGAASGPDNCGTQRDVAECGPCSTGFSCSAAGECVECTTTEDDATFCANAGKDCGSYTGPDSCGVQHTADCGECTGTDEVCTNNVCTVPGAPLNDNCAGAEPLQFSSGSASVAGSTALATDDADGSCNSSSSTGKDVVYSFTIDAAEAPLNLDAVLDSQSFDASIYLTRACPASAGDELECKDTPEELHQERLAAGTYFIWIDGWSSGSGAYTLDVNLSTPPQAPANDLCASPEALNFNGTDTATTTGTTLGAGNDGTGTCATMSGGDVVYSFEITGTDNRSATAVVTPDGNSTTYRPAVYILSADCATGTQVACGSASAGQAATAAALSLAPGVYYVLVDGVSSTEGGFSLSVQTGPERVLPDDCATAEPLSFMPDATVTGTSVAHAAGDTTLATDSGRGTCGSSSATAKDLVYSFTIDPADAPKNFDMVLTDSWDAVVYLSTACPITDGAAQVLQCKDEPEELHLKRLPAGTYYVWIDGYGSSSAGAFSMQATLSDPPPAPLNDLCSAATPLDFAGADTVSVPGTTVNATNDSTGSCGTMTGGDVVYSFTVPGTDPRMVTARVTRDSGATSFYPAVYLRTDCADAATQASCGVHSSGVATAAILSAAAGTTYYVIVDGTGTSEGPFTLEVTLGAALDLPDTCANAEVIDVSSGSATVHGDTTYALHDTNGTCGGSSSVADVVYSFTLQESRHVDVTLSGASADWVLYMRKNDCASTAAADSLGCKDAGGGGGSETINLTNLAAGTYWIWVDGYSSSSKGPFDLTIATTLPAANESCTGAEPIVLTEDPAAGIASGSALGSTTGAGNEYQGSCGGASGELVYSFELASEKTVRVALTPDAGSTHKPVIYLRSSCDDSNAQVAGTCVAATTVGSALSLTVPRLAAGTYSLFVDGQTTTAGSFTVAVEAEDPPQAPAHDVCDGMPLDLSAGTVTVQGETTFAANDTTGTCYASSGADLVYTVVVPSGQTNKLTATVTADAATPGFKPAVYLRTVCASDVATDEVTCAAPSSGAATAVVNELAAGTYFLFVDGKDGTYGSFSLTVTLDAPVSGPANDSCAFAELLTVDMAATPPSVTVPGNTAGAQNELNGTCAANNAGDVVYSLTTLADHKITATVTPDSTSGAAIDPAVYIRSTCSSALAADQLVCNDSSPAIATVKYAPAGTYYVWVDGDSASGAGAFSLEVKLEDPILPPAGDTCANAIALTLGTQVTGSTVDATDDYGNVIFPGVCDAPLYSEQDGEDLVYSYTPAADGAFTITLTPTASDFDIAVWVTAGACGDPTACAMAADTGFGGGAETLTVQGVANTTYFIVVDSFSRGEVGPFTLVVN